MKEQGITTLLSAPAAYGFSAGIFEILACFVVKKSCLPSVFSRLPVHGLFTGNPVNCAIVSLLIPVITGNAFATRWKSTGQRLGFWGGNRKYQVKHQDVTGSIFRGGFLKLCNHPVTAMQAAGGWDVNYEIR